MRSKSSGLQKKKPDQIRYNYVDKTGTFLLERESGYRKEKKDYIVRYRIYEKDSPAEDEAKILEQGVSVSTPGFLKKKISILRPAQSQYAVWLEKKKYQTEMKLNPKRRSLEIKMTSPETAWNGTREVLFPKKSTGVYCFFSQLIECAAETDFLKMAMEKDAGVMSFYVIWDGYPYFREQYSNIPDEVFSKASLEYEGKNEKGEVKFSLRVAGQSIFYFVDKNSNFLKLFWVAQGVSITPRGEIVDASEDGDEQ